MSPETSDLLFNQQSEEAISDVSQTENVCSPSAVSLRLFIQPLRLAEFILSEPVPFPSGPTFPKASPAQQRCSDGDEVLPTGHAYRK